MMSINYIRQLAREATVRASKRKLEPRVLSAADLQEDARAIPNLGDFVAPGWELAKVYFVDASGFGDPGEPALTQGQFFEAISPQVLSDKTYGYGIVESGQFQVYIGEYRRKTRATSWNALTRL